MNDRLTIPRRNLLTGAAALAAYAALDRTAHADNLTLLDVSGGYQYPLSLAPGALVALGLRCLSSSYGGACVNIRRSSDNTAEDIGFVGPNFDTETFSRFVGVGSGFVTTWYDQSGNANNVMQATAANQPQLVLGATPNGRPSLSFSGSQFLYGSGNVGTGSYPQTYAAVFSSAGSGGFEPIITIDSGTDSAQLQISSGNAVVIAAAGGPSISISANTFYSAVGVLASSALATLYAASTSASAAPGAIGGAAPIGVAHSTDGFFTNFNGEISEAVVWLSAVSAVQAVITNQRAYYDAR